MSDNQTQNTEELGQPLDVSGLIKDGKLLGKYDTPQALEEGYWNAVNEMNNVKGQLGTAVEIIKAMQQGPPQTQSTGKPKYEEDLATLGIPVDALNQLIEARASAIANKVVGEQLNPLVSGSAARSEISGVYEDFADNEKAIMRYVKSNSALDARFEALLQAGMPYEALEMGYHRWKAQHKPQMDPQTGNARRAASVPTGGAGVGRMSGVQPGPSTEQVDAAELAAAGGDFRDLIAMRLKDTPLTYTEQMEALFKARN